MGQGYIRDDVTNQIANGNVVDADALDGEFDAIVAAFHGTTGHTHDGTTGEGGPVAFAAALATARAIEISGDVTGTANFDGTAAIDIVATVVNDSHTHDTQYVKLTGSVLDTNSGAFILDGTSPVLYFRESDVSDPKVTDFLMSGGQLFVQYRNEDLTGAATAMIIEAAGTSMSSAQTAATREKGDERWVRVSALETEINALGASPTGAQIKAAILAALA